MDTLKSGIPVDRSTSIGKRSPLAHLTISMCREISVVNDLERVTITLKPWPAPQKTSTRIKARLHRPLFEIGEIFMGTLKTCSRVR